MNKKLTLLSVVILILFVGFIIIYMNKIIAKSERMPGMSENGDIKEMKVHEVHKIVQSELLKEINKHDVMIVDLREPNLYKKSHIPNSINIPFADFQNRLKELDPQKNVILICHMGSMGEASGQILLEQGFKHVYNLSGGMAQWSGPLEN